MTLHPHAPTRARRTVWLLSAVFALVACSGARRATQTLPRLTEAAVHVTGENASDVFRELDEDLPTSSGYRERRDAAARWAALRGMDRMDDGDYDGAVRSLRSALVGYAPDEIGAGGLPTELAPLARAIAEVASERGNEARAIAANRVLAAVAHPDPHALDRMREINDWGDRNRHEFQAPWVYLGEMADIYKEVARIVPAPDVLNRVSELLLGRHRAAIDGTPRHPPAQGGMRALEDQRERQMALRNTPIDLALVFLRIGDVQRAADELGHLREGSGGGLASALHAIANAEGGADGLAELAARLERVDMAAMAGVCRRGRREYPSDARFARCLALAAREDDPGLASAHLESAVQLAPTDQRLLQAAIATAVDWLVHELASDDPAPGRRAFVRARALLGLWAQRYPRQSAPITEGDLEEFAAQLELGQANLRGAEEHLQRAIAARPPARDAFVTLAEIAWRHHDGRRAIEVLRQGLALPLRPTEADSLFRPSFILRIGLAARMAGDAPLAQQSLTDAASALDALTRAQAGRPRANAFYWRAVALDALGQRDTLHDLLTASIESADDDRDLHGRSITFSLARGRWSDASDFYRIARAQLNLERTWQVYFGLWGAHAARLGRLPSDHGAAAVLEGIAHTASVQSHPTWTMRLAQRFTGALTREQLLAHAQSPGQRAESLFYEALGELSSGDVAAAERDLRGVVATEMLRYFEYEMAWEMLERGVASIAPPPATTANPGPRPPATVSSAATRPD